MPENAPTSLMPLTLGEPTQNALDCDQRDCNHWYRINPREAGVLEIQVVLEGQHERPLIRALLRPLGQPVLDQAFSEDGAPIELSATVRPGPYTLLVQATGGELPYEVTASLTLSEP